MVRLKRLTRLYLGGLPSQAGKTAARVVVSLALAVVLVWFLSSRLADIVWVDVGAGLTAVPWHQWLAASLATAISFWAVGQYDAVLHRHFATGLPGVQARRAGICAIAVSQTTGLGVITGAIVRWRMLPGQSLSQAVRLTVGVAVSFLAGWAVITAVVLLALPDAPFNIDAPFKTVAAVVLLIAAGFGAVCVFARPDFVRLPNGITLLQLLGLCAVDTIAAGIAFYLLCPDGINLTIGHLLPVFLLALGAGLLSGTPGGVGAFELTMLALLPAVSEPDFMAAVLAWRVIYYALPAILGAGFAIKGPETLPQAALAPTTCAASPPLPSPCAQASLVHQGQHQILPMGKGGWLCARTAHFVIGLFDPKDACALAGLGATARRENRLPALYHASPRAAVRARRSGFTALRTAQEAWLCPASFDLATPSRSGLRRKLRKGCTDGASVTTADPHGPIPWPQLDRIAHDWAMSHGGERGFSMGRYSRDYVRHQRLYIAWVNAQPVAFVTFHQTRDDWALDLVRHGANPPDGVMHMLIHAAIIDAARSSVARLSLAAVPDIVIGPCNGMLHRLIARVARKKTAGLAQFKSSFRPNWRPLYLAVAHPIALPLVCAEIARAVFWPKPLQTPAYPQTKPGIEHHHEDYEFASARTAWHRQAE